MAKRLSLLLLLIVGWRLGCVDRLWGQVEPSLVVTLSTSEPTVTLGDDYIITVEVANQGSAEVKIIELDLDVQSVSLTVKKGKYEGVYTRVHDSYFKKRDYAKVALAPGKSLKMEVRLPAMTVGKHMWQAQYAGAGGLVGSEALEVEVVAKEGKRSLHAVVDTDLGEMSFALDEEQALCSTMQICSLIQSGWYSKGTMEIFAVNKDAGFQFGDPNNIGTGGPGYNLIYEETTRKHEKGTLSLARKPADPDSAGSVLMVSVDELPQLDGRYLPLGAATDEASLQVLSKIAQVEVADPQNPKVAGRPVKAIKLRSIKLQVK